MVKKKKKTRTYIITSDDVLGKETIDPDGSVLGVVTKVHIDKKTLNLKLFYKSWEENSYEKN